MQVWCARAPSVMVLMQGAGARRGIVPGARAFLASQDAASLCASAPRAAPAQSSAAADRTSPHRSASVPSPARPSVSPDHGRRPGGGGQARTPTPRAPSAGRSAAVDPICPWRSRGSPHTSGPGEARTGSFQASPRGEETGDRTRVLVSVRDAGTTAEAPPEAPEPHTDPRPFPGRLFVCLFAGVCPHRCGRPT